MNKKLIAVAIGAALSGSAFAQSSNVTLYGRINTAIENNKYDANGTENAMRSYSSRLGVRGVEDLGDGLKGVFGIEASLAADNGDTSTNTSTGATSTLGVTPTSTCTVGGNAPAGSTCAVTTTNTAGSVPNGVGFGALRNVYVGVDTGKTGRIVLGRLDAAVNAPLYQQITSVIDLVGHDAGSFQMIGSTNKNQTIAVQQRTSNAIGYDVTVSGVKISSRLAMNGTNDEGVAAASTTGESSQRALEIAASYVQGPLTVGAGFEKGTYSQAQELAGKAGFDQRLQAVVGYDFGFMKAGLSYARNEVEPLAATTGADKSGSEIALSATAPIVGKLSGVANYAKRDIIGVANNAANFDAAQKQWALGARYDFTKRTQAYALLGRKDTNDKLNNATDDVRTIAFGVRHNF